MKPARAAKLQFQQWREKIRRVLDGAQLRAGDAGQVKNRRAVGGELHAGKLAREHAPQPDGRPGARRRVERAERKQLRHAGTKLRQERCPFFTRVGPEDHGGTDLIG